MRQQCSTLNFIFILVKKFSWRIHFKSGEKILKVAKKYLKWRKRWRKKILTQGKPWLHMNKITFPSQNLAGTSPHTHTHTSTCSVFIIFFRFLLSHLLSLINHDQMFAKIEDTGRGTSLTEISSQIYWTCHILFLKYPDEFNFIKLSSV